MVPIFGPGGKCNVDDNTWPTVSHTRGQDYKEKHKTRLKTNVKRTVLNNTKLRHF